MSSKYKNCPLKKRPILYTLDNMEGVQNIKQCVEQNEALALITSHVAQPEDLSLKHKTYNHLNFWPTNRNCAINLSKSNTEEGSSRVRQQELSHSSVLLSPISVCEEVNQYVNYFDTHSNIHLRGVTNSIERTINPYKAAFVTEAGCGSVNGLWNICQPSAKLNDMYPSPAYSLASESSLLSTRSSHIFLHITPPISPTSDNNFEAEDLTMRSDIPIPALYHGSDEKKYSAFLNNKNKNKTGLNNENKKKNCYSCDKCHKIYSTTIGLSKHKQFHCTAAEYYKDKKHHFCDKCGKPYTSSGALKMHIRTHTLPCKCPICGKAFSRPWLLQGHIRTHTGEKPFKCTDCPRSFADRSNLRAHQQTHSEMKKYACKTCTKTFSRLSLLNKHCNPICTS